MIFLPSNVVIARDLQSDMSGLVPCHTGPAGVSAQYQRASPLAPMGQGCSATWPAGVQFHCSCRAVTGWQASAPVIGVTWGPLTGLDGVVETPVLTCVLLGLTSVIWQEKKSYIRECEKGEITNKWSSGVILAFIERVLIESQYIYFKAVSSYLLA